jgi:hypothetical protein
MIDVDDVGNGFAFGGLIVGLIFLAIYFYYSKPEIDKCHEKGGQIVRIEGNDKCIASDALKEIK